MVREITVKGSQRFTRKQSYWGRLTPTQRKKIGELLRKARKEKGWDEKTLADKTGISPEQITKTERGHFDTIQQFVLLSHITTLGLTPKKVGLG